MAKKESLLDKPDELKDTLGIYVEKGLVSKQKHPYYDLFIYNYTSKTQYERAWDEVTMFCRGLILDKKGNIVSRPFPKFFNLEELSRSDVVFSKPFKAFEKMDGSLGIVYKLPVPSKEYTHAVATRGSFVSEQAMWATTYLQANYCGNMTFPEDVTLLCEIIYPANRIVVDYQGSQGLFLLAAIDNKTGRDIDFDGWIGPKAKHYEVSPGTKPRKVLAELNIPDDGNNEGLVLVFDYPKEGPNRRVKIKLDEYKRLHRLMTMVSTKTIWEHLANNMSLDELLDRVPDEFYNWVKETMLELTTQQETKYHEYLDQFLNILDELYPSLTYGFQVKAAKENRANFAQAVKDSGHNHKMMFGLLDKKDINPWIWNEIRPAYERPFADNGEGDPDVGSDYDPADDPF